MKLRERIISLFVIGLTVCTAAHAFQISFPKGYLENLKKKQQKESATLWNELARNEVELIVRSYAEKSPVIDGVNIQEYCNNLPWEKGPYLAIKMGRWCVSMDEWDNKAPLLKSINWEKDKLIISLPYDFLTKTVAGSK